MTPNGQIAILLDKAAIREPFVDRPILSAAQISQHVKPTSSRPHRIGTSWFQPPL